MKVDYQTEEAKHVNLKKPLNLGYEGLVFHNLICLIQ